ncbi:MAG: hypothetical protein WCH46_06075 [bacterium]
MTKVHLSASILFAFLTLCVSTSFAQHWLEVDDGLSHFTIVKPATGSLGVKFTLPSVLTDQVFLTQGVGSPSTSNSLLWNGNQNGTGAPDPVIPGYGKFGTQDNVSLTVITNNTTRMTISSSGNGDVAVSGNITPMTDNNRSLGNPTHRWQEVYVGPASLHVISGAPVRDYAIGINGGGDLTFSEAAGPTVPFTLSQVGDATVLRNLNVRGLSYIWPTSLPAAPGASLISDNAGNLSWTGSVILHITETYTTAAPYSAGNAGLREAATGADANIDFALSPKGTGAIEAQLADGAVAGGNKRGANAVDWQTSRSAATQVASGSASVVAGGNSNTASGNGSFVGGGGYDGISTLGNTASGNASTIAGGFNLLASGAYSSIGGGQDNQATGAFHASVGGGFANIASAQASAISGGSSNTASAQGAFVGGGGYDGTTTSGNAASGKASAIGGGLGNKATDDYSVVGGGKTNQAGDNAGTTSDHTYATVGGGLNNKATGTGSVVAGGGTDGLSLAGNAAQAVLRVLAVELRTVQLRIMQPSVAVFSIRLRRRTQRLSEDTATSLLELDLLSVVEDLMAQSSQAILHRVRPQSLAVD